MKNEKAYLKKLAMDTFADDDFFYSKLKKSSKVKKGPKKVKGRDDYEV
jgi:hypothetical protein